MYPKIMFSVTKIFADTGLCISPVTVIVTWSEDSPWNVYEHLYNV